ncbi:MAG: nitroreductase-family protein, partial [Bacillota bacterium]|nr:nitroreductase-family protein [Bacillota bacterium]
MDYKTIISKKRSVRNYKKDTVDDKVFDELKVYYKNHKKLVDGIEIEILVKSKNDVYEKLNGVAGYKGIMLEAPHYMIILSDEKQNYIENAGYVVENIMVKAYDLGVGSCWITFDDGELIKEKLSIKSDKKLAGLIALGFDDNKLKIFNEPKTGDNPSKANIRFEEDNVTIMLDVEDVVFIEKWGNRADADELQIRGLLDAFNFARFAPSSL